MTETDRRAPFLAFKPDGPSTPMQLGQAATLVLVALLAGLALAAMLPLSAPPQLEQSALTAIQAPWAAQPYVAPLEWLAICATLLLAVLARRHPAERWFSAAAAVALAAALPIPYFLSIDPGAAALLAASPGPITAEWQQWLIDCEIGQALRFGLQLTAAAALALAMVLRSPAEATPRADVLPKERHQHRGTAAEDRYQRLF